VTFGPDGSQQEARPGANRLVAREGIANAIMLTSEAAAASGRDPSPAEPVEAAPRAKPALRTAAIPQQAAPSISESAGGSGNFFVQIAARNDQDAAMTAFASLQQKYAGVLGNHSPSVRKVDLGDKGVWYRLLVGPMDSKTDADALCEQLKTAGMKGCFARKD
jgi:cell division protein FtsN